MKRLPKFKSEEAEAHFWNQHSPLDYPEEFADLKDPLEFAPTLLRGAAERRAERKRLLTLRMEQRQIDLAKIIAKWKGLGYQTQMRMWIIAGIREELRAHPEMKKLLGLKQIQRKLIEKSRRDFPGHLSAH